MTARIAPAPKQISRRVQLRLGMAQLAFRGLAEDWWLKHLGDVHWQLIADSVGQNTTLFKDRAGRQTYAAFCATEFDQPHPDHAGLGGTLDVTSTLWSAGRSRLQSIHILKSGDITVARFRLMSTFVCHEKDGVNASISRSMPYLIPVLDPAPDDFAARTGTAARACRTQGHDLRDHVLIQPCIGTDFNAVGLLYFPSFTRFFDQTERGLVRSTGWSPLRRRRVLYFNNIEHGDDVIGASCADGLELWCAGGRAAEPRKLAHCAFDRF
ncbi:Pnap_2097 family protein [Roseobacter sp.]|uniref:Pnap_2097 family protein n=1 Tax=Roseobacter sp. TaxID=1907202 RepID=UPI00329833E5